MWGGRWEVEGRPAVDDIDFVQSDDVDHFLPLLQLPIRAGHEFGGGTHGVVVAGARETSAELRDSAGGFIDGNNVARVDLLLGQRFDHLGAEVVYGFHVRCFEGQFPRFSGCASCRWSVDLNLDHLALDDLRLLRDANADGLSESLRRRWKKTMKTLNLIAGGWA